MKKKLTSYCVLNNVFLLYIIMIFFRKRFCTSSAWSIFDVFLVYAVLVSVPQIFTAVDTKLNLNN